jgi:hypothetical protein
MVFSMHAMKAYRGEEVYFRTFLNLDCGCSSVVTLTPLSAYAPAKSARYPFHKRLGGFQNRSRCFAEGINFLTSPRI